MTRALSGVLLAVAFRAALAAQGPFGPPAAQPPRSPREGAPADLTGTWVSPVMEDYRWRMVTPLKGDAASVPYRQDARKVIDAWDPAKDEAAGLQCRAYGAPAVMRIPGRVRISWQDDSTLKIETDAGSQTRLFHFASGGQAKGPVNAKPSWQGYSVAKWETPSTPPPGFVLGGSARWGSRSQSLEVVTTNLRAGYLRKNGLPYSEQAIVTEYYDRFSEANGQEWFTVTTIVNDPVYLMTPFVTTTDFRREPDASKFSPTPCSAR